MKTPDKPQLNIMQLLQAAQLAQIDPSTIPSDQTPLELEGQQGFCLAVRLPRSQHCNG